MDAQGLVGGQRPGRRRPDHGIHRTRRQHVQVKDLSKSLAILFDELEADVDGRGRVLLVLDLGFRERGAAIKAPVHGFGAAIHMAVLQHLAEGAQLLRLVLGIHGAIGVIPVAQHPQPFEVGALALDLLLGKGTAGGPERLDVELLAGAALLLLDLQLDRQSVAIPARHIGRIEAIQEARFDDDVFQDLVDGVADVNHAIGIGRTVMQYKARPALRHLALTAVDGKLVPMRKRHGLAPGKVRLHRKVRLRQVDRVLVVHRALNTPKCAAPARHRHASAG